jgi:hypothetical protein
MSTENTQSLNNVSTSESKDKAFQTQLKTIFNYLKNHTATASMVTAATGIPQKCVTRYKRDLEKAGRLAEVKKSICKYTGHKAWYLTTNTEQFPQSNQLQMF